MDLSEGPDVSDKSDKLAAVAVAGGCKCLFIKKLSKKVPDTFISRWSYQISSIKMQKDKAKIKERNPATPRLGRGTISNIEC